MWLPPSQGTRRNCRRLGPQEQTIVPGHQHRLRAKQQDHCLAQCHLHTPSTAAGQGCRETGRCGASSSLLHSPLLGPVPHPPVTSCIQGHRPGCPGPAPLSSALCLGRFGVTLCTQQIPGQASSTLALRNMRRNGDLGFHRGHPLHSTRALDTGGSAEGDAMCSGSSV